MRIIELYHARCTSSCIIVWSHTYILAKKYNNLMQVINTNWKFAVPSLKYLCIAPYTLQRTHAPSSLLLTVSVSNCARSKVLTTFWIMGDPQSYQANPTLHVFQYTPAVLARDKSPNQLPCHCLFCGRASGLWRTEAAHIQEPTRQSWNLACHQLTLETYIVESPFLLTSFSLYYRAAYVKCQDQLALLACNLH